MTIEEEAEKYAKECFPNDEFKQAMVEDACLKFYKQGQQKKSLEVICKDCSIQKQIGKQCDDLMKKNAELKADLQILFNMLNGGDKNEFEQQRIGEMWNLCF